MISLSAARTLDYILFFTNKGRVYSSRVYELPEGGRNARGAHIANVLSLMPDETISTMLVVPDFEQAEYVTLITQGADQADGALRLCQRARYRFDCHEFGRNDSLDWARLTSGDEEFILVTRVARRCASTETALRPMGRTFGVMADAPDELTRRNRQPGRGEAGCGFIGIA